ncbi:MAG: hypothetical protein DRJ52_01520 [Thermoprotei archaeon]|nr:MAG: hypothetical protein DRJ52_01520 [Thermoprotei archaeon]RLF00161.1 MAG: hypothetical protein DRJ63_03340 [Thermoprotei archaeon]HDI74993.1 acetyl-CoA carboxylase biotin carboxyl carrier protein subunit [Thermoprotei archaeon]
MRKRLRIFLGEEIFEVEVEYFSSKSKISKAISPRKVLKSFSKRNLASIGVFKKQIVSPISGKVILVKAREGSFVKKGDVVAVLESMKTKVEIHSHRDGVIKKILVREGDFIKSGSAVAEIGD